MAVDQFTYVLRKFIGSYIAVLGGLDTLVFTGGIGEHDAATRQEVCAGLEAFHIQLDDSLNQSPTEDAGGLATISAADSTVKVMVISAKEDLMIADHVYSLMSS